MRAESMATEPAGNDEHKGILQSNDRKPSRSVLPAYFTGNTVFDAVPISPAARQTVFPVKYPILLGGTSLVWLGGLYTRPIDKTCCLDTVRIIRVPAVTTRPLTDHTHPNPISPETRCVSPLTTLTTHETLRSQLLALTPISTHSR